MSRRQLRRIQRRAGLAIALAGPRDLAASPADGRRPRSGTTIGQFLGIEPSARIAAWGTPASRLDGGSRRVYFNPAAIGCARAAGGRSSPTACGSPTSATTTSAARSRSALGTLFASVTSLSSGDIDVRTVDQPLGTGERYTVRTRVGLRLRPPITDRFGAGGAGELRAGDHLAHARPTSFTFSFGHALPASRTGVQLGASLSNLGTGAQFDGRDLAHPVRRRPRRARGQQRAPGRAVHRRVPGAGPVPGGPGYPWRSTRRTAPARGRRVPSERQHREHEPGGEWSCARHVALRAGYQNLFQEDSELGLTAGAGLQAGIERDRNSSSTTPGPTHEHLEDTHRVTLVLEF